MKAKRMHVWALAALAAAAAGCDCGDRTKAVSPQLVVAPAQVAFGKVSVGASAEQMVDVRNNGSAALELRGVRVTKPALSAAGADQVAVAKLLAIDCEGNPRDASASLVNGGDCVRFAVRYVPAETGPIAAVVTIESNDLERPALELPVTGEGISAKLRLCALKADGTEDPAACTALHDADAAAAARRPEVAFGAAPVGDLVKRAVRVHNDGEGQLVVSGVTVASDFPDFAVEGAPVQLTVEPGASADVTVKFKPTGDGPETGKLAFATNDLANPVVELPLVAEAQGPRLCILPTGGIDFGAIPVNTTRTLSLSLKNCGFVPYQLQTLEFNEDAVATPVNFAVSPTRGIPALPQLLMPGDIVEVDLVYKPTATARHSGFFSLATEFQRGRVPVTGEGAPAACGGSVRPTAVIAVKQGSTNITANPQVKPLTVVTLDGSGSAVPRAVAAADRKYKWRLVGQPPTGNQNVAPYGARPQLADLFAELIGDYEVELVVGDQYGCDSAPVRAVVKVASQARIHLQLTWAENFGDVDLHYIKPGGRYNDRTTNTDCHWDNCMKSGPYAGYNVRWGSGGANPTLDVDETNGRGPENITHELPGDGDYQVVANYFCSRIGPTYGQVNATVRISVNGNASNSTYTQALTPGKRWAVATLQVRNNGQSVTVSPTNTVANGGCE